jgi:hypothetical protein
MKLLGNIRFWVELLQEPSNDLLVQESFEGLERLAAETRYEAVGRGFLPDEPGRMSARFAPLIQAAGQASLAGLRVEICHEQDPDRAIAVEYGDEVVASRGLELAADLVSRGVLKEGDRYLVRLVSGPKPPAAGPGDEAGSGSAVSESPFPVRAGGLDGFGIGPDVIAEAHADRPVFIARTVLDEAIADAVAHGHDEVGTLLLGVLLSDPALRAAGCRTSWAVVVTAHVPVSDGENTAASFIFPPDAFRRARHIAKLRGRGETVVGSQHSHGWNCPNCAGQREIRNIFFSSDDERMTHHFPVYAPFLVVGGDPDRSRDHPVASLFVQLLGTTRSIPYGTF